VISAPLGKINSSLKIVRLAGNTKLIVSPWAAIGTDAFLMGTSTALFFATRSTILRILSVLGGAWAATAVTLELAKLAQDAKDA